jgi:hypothetical protein
MILQNSEEVETKGWREYLVVQVALKWGGTGDYRLAFVAFQDSLYASLTNPKMFDTTFSLLRLTPSQAESMARAGF